MAYISSSSNYNDIVVLDDYDNNTIDIDNELSQNGIDIPLIVDKTDNHYNIQLTEAAYMLVEMTQISLDKVNKIVYELYNQLKTEGKLENMSDLSGFIVEHCLDEILAKGYNENNSDIINIDDNNPSKRAKSNNHSSNSTISGIHSNTEYFDLVDNNNPSRSHNKTSSDNIVITDIITPLSQVLTIFPFAKKSFIQTLLDQNNNNYELVVQICSEKGYEKADKIKSNEVKINDIDYMKITSFETSLKYRDEVITLLQNDYPYIQVTGLKHLLMKYQYHYAPTVDIIEKTIELLPYDYRKFNNVVLTDDLFTKLSKLNLKYKATVRKSPFYLDLSTLDPILLNEVTWIKKKRRQQMEVVDRQMAEKLNEQIATEEGSMIECGCCYSEYPFENIIQCSEGHLFCKDCLQRYVETTVFGDGRSHISCMNTGRDACEGYFPESMLKNSLSDVVFKKFQEAMVKDAIKGAKLENMCTCYDCSMQVEMADDAGNVMVCPSCGKETCKLCGDESHIPLRCEEVEKKGQTEVRLTVEEAMTQARIRQCPKCKTRFYKTEGCNKMSCSCGTKICYICREDITKPQYSHFCQTAHCKHEKCGKCKLFTDSVEDDRLAMYEAGLKALKGNETTAENGTETTVQLDKLLEGGKIPKPDAKRVNQPPQPLQPVQLPPFMVIHGAINPIPIAIPVREVRQVRLPQRRRRR